MPTTKQVSENAARNTTCASASRAFASSLATAGTSVRFLVLARDWFARDTAKGGDAWELTIADARDNNPDIKCWPTPRLWPWHLHFALFSQTRILTHAHQSTHPLRRF